MKQILKDNCLNKWLNSKLCVIKSVCTKLSCHFRKKRFEIFEIHKIWKKMQEKLLTIQILTQIQTGN